jgi:LytS/YehU family sensor histidine kinase
MKTRIVTSTFLVASLLAFGIGAAAQRSTDDKSPDQTIQGQTSPGMMGGGMMGQGQGMMGGGMTGMMGQMTAHHEQMSALMNQLIQSMTAIQSEKDPTALKSKLAEHQALLEKMRSQMMGQANTLKMMSGQVQQYCPAVTGDEKAKTK